MRMLHTMLRVGNLEQSLKFYTEVLGMTLLRKRDYEEGRFTLAFVGYGEEDSTTVLELTHNWDTDQYDLGNAYGHIAIGVEDAYKACEEIKARGGKVIYNDSGYKKHGNSARQSQGVDVSRKPVDGQAALNNSVPLGENTKARVGVDINNKEVVILKNNSTPSNEYHGYVPEKLTTQEANVVNKNFRDVVTVSNNGTCKVKC